MTKEQVKRSKLLSLILRHDPGAFGLILEDAGWLDVASLLVAVPQISLEELEEIVANNDKKRFEFNEGHTRIRASQGHSVEVDLGYVETEPPISLFHGTSRNSLGAIYADGGLKRMSRHHVHLSESMKTAMVVAARRPPPVIFLVKAIPMLKAGYKFYRSTNGVWLTDNVPNEYMMIVD